MGRLLFIFSVGNSELPTIEPVTISAHKMLSLLCVVVVVGLTAGQEHGCCVPDVWEGSVHAHAGIVLDRVPRIVNVSRVECIII